MNFMKKGAFLAGLLISTVITLIVFLNDIVIIKFISSLRTEALDYIFLGFTFAGNIFIIFFFLTTIFLWKEHRRKWIFPLWMSLLISTAIVHLLKVIIARPRPFQDGLISVLQIGFHFIRNNFNTWNFSFPSWHAAIVFAAIPILNKEFRKFKYIWIVFACLAAFSRTYFGLHYLSDILAGAIIGYLVGYIMVISEERQGYGKRLMNKLKIKS
jgi:undecaprenyl-diphosphatase